ncbi:B-cell receptor CD22-like isoform X2 [Xenia sp. Carnegie-2017]|uniref:B-cell receptor CD22-like isoform X2 n=1 Tax=Xenia sp. Carnegie-2017 TaxID=2897299 RepID=UPI001F0436FB|nr:B-cell receptor CD22-like isoform X2 [Xenia sp. Carnegie-2017]
MMKASVRILIVAFSIFILSCRGTIIPPPDGQRFVFLPGSSHNISWTLNVTGNINAWLWNFTPRGSSSPQQLATIFSNSDTPQYSPSPLTFEVFKLGTLRLKNVNQSYNGEFEFSILATPSTPPSKVNVYIAVKPNATINCSSPLFVNESDGVSCVCRGEGGNPPANVTWFDKDNNIIGDVGVESKTLVITGASPNDRGSYRCKAESFNDPRFIDEKSIEIIVNYKPRSTTITLSKINAKIGKSVIISCESDGFPPPAFIIYHNDAVVSDKKTYSIQSVNISHKGSYRCEANNKLGNDSSDVKNLTVSRVGKDGDGGSNIGLIIGIVVGMLFLVAILVVVIFCCYKSKQKNGYHGENGVEPLAGANNPQPNHYEEAGGLRENAYESVGNQYETVNNPATSNENKPSTSKAPPPVYASIDRENREGNPLYSYLDFKDEPKRKPDKNRPAPTEYASIDMSKLAPVEKKDDKKGGDKKGDEKKE